MREILFRGKRTDNGEWVKGFYVIIASENHCIFTGRIDLTQGSIGYEYFKVDPETVGQFTGLIDKNGRQIFEGDILSEKPPMNNVAYIGYVKYDGELAAYRIVFNNPSVVHILGSYSTSYTVIGNINDNPKMLKASNE